MVLHLIVVPQLGGSRQHNYSTKTRQTGHANEQYMYSLMSMVSCHPKKPSHVKSLELSLKITYLGYFG